MDSLTLDTKSFTCTLCGLALADKTHVDSDRVFCCHGCQAVFTILAAKKQLDHFEEHPIFQKAVKAGLISNPHLLEQLRQKQAAKLSQPIEKMHLEINEMWCPSCAEVIRLVLMQEKGVLQCVVDYATDLASIEYSPMEISKEAIFDLIRSLGYVPAPLQSPEKRAVSFDLYLRFAIAAFFSLNIMMFAYPLYATYFDLSEREAGPLFAWLSCLASLPVLTYSAWPVLRRCWHSLLVGLPGMELLVVIGVAAAFGLSVHELWEGGTRVYFDSMTVIITFVLLGKIIEAKAKFSAKDSLLRLSRAIPRRGRKRSPNGDLAFVPLKEIEPGDCLVALKGEKIVLDGIVIEGKGACDESLMTGEAWPVAKEAGSPLLGGTLLQSGWLAYKVTTTLEASALQRIIHMVEKDVDHKVKYVRAADQIVRWFVPVVLGIAFFSGVAAYLQGENGIIRAVSVLLISCPCAIGIAAPLAEAHLLNGLAKLGAIVRNRGCLSYLGKETLFIFDKTGTVTEGHFRVLEGLEELDEKQLRLLKSLSLHSTHPISCAIAEAISERGLSLEAIEEVAGRGVQGIYEGRLYCLGSSRFLLEKGIQVEDTAEVQGRLVTTVYFGHVGGILANIRLGDSVRPGIKALLEELTPVSITLLSGDGRQAVESLAHLCGFTSYRWGCSPLEKREWVEQAKEKGEVVCMVGDGINDAAALTAAHIGISMVNAADISIQISDILLTTDRLGVIGKIRALATKGRRIIRENLFWAFFYNLIGIGLAAWGILSPIFAAFAMVASSLMVLFNAQRLSKS